MFGVPATAGISITVTDALLISPGLASAVSATVPVRVTGLVVPPGALTCTVCGFAAAGVMEASSRITFSELLPELPAKFIDADVRTAVTGWDPAAVVVVQMVETFPPPETGSGAPALTPAT